jgi:hypothetical protein
MLYGAVHHVHVVGNCIMDSRNGAIPLTDLLPGSTDILVANNTLLRNGYAVGVWDDHSKGKDYLKCKNIRVQNNLVLAPRVPGDMFFNNHVRGQGGTERPGDLTEFLNSKEWHFDHNWRDVDEARARADVPERFIPFRPGDHRTPENPVLSSTPGDRDFLRPPKDSPLATGGAGGSLPGYVGAVPPEGVEPWDWNRTWTALAR